MCPSVTSPVLLEAQIPNIFFVDMSQPSTLYTVSLAHAESQQARIARSWCGFVENALRGGHTNASDFNVLNDHIPQIYSLL
jgi:hypothetical protein